MRRADWGEADFEKDNGNADVAPSMKIQLPTRIASRARRAIGLAALALAAVGCGDSPIEPASCEPTDPGPSISGDQLALLPPPPSTFRTPDDEWADIARAVPGGWGGAFFEVGELVIYLVDPTQREAAAAALGARLPGFDYASASVWKARWDFAQLYDWYRYIAVVVGWPGGLVSRDIDEYRNRLVYGALPDSIAAVQAALESADLPCELFIVEEGSPVVVLPGH